MVQSMVARCIVSVRVSSQCACIKSLCSQNAGQNCIGIERLIVHSSQYDDLREIFESTIAALRLGTIWPPPDGEYVTPVDMGSMIDGFRFQHIQTLIKDAEENYGADTVGGERHNAVYYPHASFFKPTVIGPVPPEAAIAQEECKWNSFCRNLFSF